MHEERVSLCENCDWIGHGTSTSNSKHNRQTVNSYSGCPSSAELSSLWPFFWQSPSPAESIGEQEEGLMSIPENMEKTSWSPTGNTISQNQNNSGVSCRMKDMSASDSNCQGAVAAEVLSSLLNFLCAYHFLALLERASEEITKIVELHQCFSWESLPGALHVLRAPSNHLLEAMPFEKRVRYASRKARVDVRKRVKERFVKAGDAYDYDPLN
ncbi:Zinc finger protein CONSTANS-LIKE 10 [Hibiscus syriacus]|uniref:Zinc finger protein CONSTANS-LIKE 10 n=1 Tax=Hibiscus syriacus TaxID=106335 RepID=A0A6A2XMP9_HIBSY|nr:Zinc finger protein CONSTANS-LIKE 10 [Hibiscus syriacus]